MEYVSTYVHENLNDSIIYMGSVKAENHGMVKEEESYTDSSSDQIDETADYSAQLYALYHSHRNLPVDVNVIEQSANLKVEPMENIPVIVKEESSVKQEADN